MNLKSIAKVNSSQIDVTLHFDVVQGDSLLDCGGQAAKGKAQGKRLRSRLLPGPAIF